MGTIPQKPSAPRPEWPLTLGMPAQPLLPIGSQPQQGLIPKFGGRSEERRNHPEFWKSFVGDQVSGAGWQGYMVSSMDVRGRGERQTSEAQSLLNFSKED